MRNCYITVSTHAQTQTQRQSHKHTYAHTHAFTDSFTVCARSCGRSEVTFLSELDLARSDFLDELKRATEPQASARDGWGNGLASAISSRDVASICGAIYLIRYSSSSSFTVHVVCTCFHLHERA